MFIYFSLEFYKERLIVVDIDCIFCFLFSNNAKKQWTVSELNGFITADNKKNEKKLEIFENKKKFMKQMSLKVGVNYSKNHKVPNIYE